MSYKYINNNHKNQQHDVLIGKVVKFYKQKPDDLIFFKYIRHKIHNYTLNI